MDYYTKITINSYDKSVKEYHNFTKKLHPKKEIRFLISLLNKKSSILDLGCGTGRDAKIFASHGFAVTGIDLSKNMVKYARKICKKAEFRVMNFKKLKFKNNSFDAVWANASLLHVKKKELSKVIKEVYRILRKGGIFFIAVKKGFGEGIFPDNRYKGIKKFWFFYTKKEIEYYLKDSSFRIIKINVIRYENEHITRPWIRVFAKKI